MALCRRAEFNRGSLSLEGSDSPDGSMDGFLMVLGLDSNPYAFLAAVEFKSQRNSHKNSDLKAAFP